MKKIGFLFINLCLILALVSCSNDDYTKALPSGSTALMYVDMKQSGGVESRDFLKRMVPIDNLGDCGLDFAQKLYFFELADGAVGLCARVSDAKQVGETLKKLAENDQCKEISEVGGLPTAVLGQSWVVAYDDDAFLLMFSVPATDIQSAKNRLVRYLKQDGDRSEKFTQLFQKLNATKGIAAVVGRGQTLLKTTDLDLPQGVEASQVLEAVSVTVEDSVVYARSNRFSFDEKVSKALNDHERVLRPIEGRYAQIFTNNAFMNIAMNVDGERFFPMIQNHETMMAFLASANAAIDMNNIIKSIDGDVAMMYFGDMMFSDSGFLLLSELAHSQWIADIDYWKTSTPKGGEIKDLGKDTYCYTDGQSQYYFGLVGGSNDGQKSTSSQQFFCGNTPNAATSPFEPVGESIPSAVVEKIKGSRLAVVVNLEKSGGILAMMLKEKFQPLFGDFNTVVYLVES